MKFCWFHTIYNILVKVLSITCYKQLAFQKNVIFVYSEEKLFTFFFYFFISQRISLITKCWTSSSTILKILKNYYNLKNMWVIVIVKGKILTFDYGQQNTKPFLRKQVVRVPQANLNWLWFLFNIVFKSRLRDLSGFDGWRKF